jgi:hypothetical protein
LALNDDFTDDDVRHEVGYRIIGQVGINISSSYLNESTRLVSMWTYNPMKYMAGDVIVVYQYQDMYDRVKYGDETYLQVDRVLHEHALYALTSAVTVAYLLVIVATMAMIAQSLDTCLHEKKVRMQEERHRRHVEIIRSRPQTMEEKKPFLMKTNSYQSIHK